MKPQIQLVFSTMCQRLSMGTFIMSLVGVYAFGIDIPMNWVALVTIAVLGVGMLGTMTHLGKPGRFLNSFSNLGSHLTQEAICTMFVGVSYLLVGIDGIFVDLPEGLVRTMMAVGVVASVAFIWISAVTYQMGARPAWNTVATPVNFLLTFLSIGTMGASLFATVGGAVVPVPFLAMLAIFTVASVAGQLFYVQFVSHVGYRVDIDVFKGETRPYFLAWLVAGVVVPAAAITALFAFPGSALLAAILVVSDAASLLAWQALFFLCGKEVWYFPQYEKDLSPDYF